MPLLPGQEEAAPASAEQALPSLDGGAMQWVNVALDALNLPAWPISAGLVLATALLVFGLTELIKGKADDKGKRPLDEEGHDRRAWQYLWRVLPAFEGLAIGALFGLLGTAPWAACLILGLAGGVFSVPIWHGVRRFAPGLLRPK